MKYLLVFLLLWLAICPAMGQNATVSVGQPVSIAVRIKPKSQVLTSRIDHALSAVGFCWHTNDHRIYYIDQNSDLSGKAYIGDIIVSSDGMSPEAFHKTGDYLNNENTPVQVKIWHNSTIYTVTVYRKPVSSFGPAWHQVMD